MCTGGVGIVFFSLTISLRVLRKILGDLGGEFLAAGGVPRGNFEAPQEEIWGAAGAPRGNLRRRGRLRRKSSSKDIEKHVFVAKNNVFRRKILDFFFDNRKQSSLCY